MWMRVVLSALLVCQFPPRLRRVHGGGFPGLLGQLCERMEGQALWIAQSFDQVSGNDSGVRIRVPSERSFPYGSYPSWQMMAHRRCNLSLSLCEEPLGLLTGKAGLRGSSSPISSKMLGFSEVSREPRQVQEQGQASGKIKLSFPSHPAGTASSSLPVIPQND